MILIKKAKTVNMVKRVLRTNAHKIAVHFSPIFKENNWRWGKKKRFIPNKMQIAKAINELIDDIEEDTEEVSGGRIVIQIKKSGEYYRCAVFLGHALFF
jgi:hypothetical protein